VTKFGLVNSGATLAAHFIGHPELMITNEKIPFLGQCRVWTTVPNTDIPMSGSFLGIVGFHPRFPYGFGVDPDEPL